MQVERSYRGISIDLALGYLESVGGEVTGERSAEGDGWSVELDDEMVEVGPSIELTEVSVVFEGDEDVLDEVVPAFDQKAIRAGG